MLNLTSNNKIEAKTFKLIKKISKALDLFSTKLSNHVKVLLLLVVFSLDELILGLLTFLAML
jgi:hypothetical protein